MKFSKSLLAVSMSAMMLFSAPVANAGILQCQTVEAAVSKTSKLNKTTANLTLGKGIQLSLSNAVPSKIMWKVSSPTILGVTQRGYVTGLKAGSAYVYATYNGRTYKCKVTVKADLSKVFLNKKSITMNEGDLYNIVLFNASGATYRSSNPSVASVTKNSDSANSSSCTVNAKKAGTATITVKYAGKSFTCRVTVNKKTKPEINIDAAELNVGETLNLKLQNASGSITWRTSNYRVAKVSSTGKVTGVAAGKATITAQNNGKKYTCTITVKNTVKRSEMKIPLYIQSDYSKVKYGNSNLAVCGDGPTCLAMIASYKTGKTVTPAEIVKWCGNKYYINGSGTSYNIFSAAKKYGIKSVTKTSSTSMVLKALQEGKPVVSVQKRGLFTNNGTFIVLRGIDKDGKMLVNSPKDRSVYSKSYDLQSQIAKTSSTFMIIN